MAMITNEINQINMLHRIGHAFGWRLEVHQNGEAINLSAYDIEWYITDVRGNTLLSATVGDGLALSVDETQLIFDTPISALDPLEHTAYAYEVHILDPMGNTPLIRGKFKVVKPLHLAAIEAAIVEDENLIQVIQSAEPTVIKIDGNAVFGLELKADLVDGKVPASQLPSFVDDVLEYANLAAFPATGEASKIYVTLDTNLTYRWTGTAYVQISESTAIWGQISGNIALQNDLQAAFTAINGSIASKYDNSNPAGYITSAALNGYATQSWVDGKGFLVANDLNGYATQSWVNAQGFALASSLSGYVPYTGATTNVTLGSNTLTAGGISVGSPVSSTVFFGAALGSATVALELATLSNVRRFRILSTNVSTTFESTNQTAGFVFNKDVIMNGSSSTTGTVLLLRNSTPTDLFTVDNTGKIGLRPTNFELWFGTIGNASYTNLKQVSGVLTLQAPNNSSTINLNGGIIGDYLTGANVYGVNITNGVNTRTITGTYSLLRLFQYISPTSGISNTNFLEISGTIQQTGGANGITRGILIAPTLTAVADFRGLEILTGNNAAHTLIKLNNGTQDVFCVKGNNQAGFFGKITGQASMPTATAGATYTAAEQTMLQAVYNAVRDFGIGN